MQHSLLCISYWGLATRSWLLHVVGVAVVSSNHKQEQGPGSHKEDIWAGTSVGMRVLSLRKCQGSHEMHQMITVPMLRSAAMNGLRKDGDVFLPFLLLQWSLQCSEVWLALGKNWNFSSFSKYYIKGKNDQKPHNLTLYIFFPLSQT